MANSIYWQSVGEGDDVVLLHGWGMNGAVWDHTVEALRAYYRVHSVDLPGYGFSADSPADSVEELVEQLLQSAPKNAVWLGWSLGGLIASYIALHYPEYVSKLVTVASSPKFAAAPAWLGIQPNILSDFSVQLQRDFRLTIERFMALQAMGSPTARQDVKRLKKAVLSRPDPDEASLLAGLNMLENIDLREQMKSVAKPVLRMYGRLDGLVPIKVATELDKDWPETESVTFSASSHAPFITESETFCCELRRFIERE